MISIVYFSLTGERKSKFTSVAGPALLRHIALSASSFKRSGLPMVLRTRVAALSVCFALACILLAAAPTISPCFRHWRRSKLLPPLGELSAEQTERALAAPCAGQRELCLSYLLRGLLHMLMHPAALEGGDAGAALLQDLIVRHEL